MTVSLEKVKSIFSQINAITLKTRKDEQANQIEVRSYLSSLDDREELSAYLDRVENHAIDLGDFDILSQVELIRDYM